MREKIKVSSRRIRLPVIVAFVLATAVLVIAGCGGSADSGSTSSTVSSSLNSAASSPPSSFSAGAPPQISAEAKACLKDQNVELPEAPAGAAGEPPAGGKAPEAGSAPGGAPSEAVTQAFEACGVEMPGAGEGQ